MKKLILILFTLAAVIAASAQNLPRIHVEGKSFVDDNGKTVIFKGLCFSDPVKLLRENKWEVDHFNEASSWNANIVRFPIHPNYTPSTLGRYFKKYLQREQEGE